LITRLLRSLARTRPEAAWSRRVTGIAHAFAGCAGSEQRAFLRYSIDVRHLAAKEGIPFTPIVAARKEHLVKSRGYHFSVTL
jgi:hypothetical protein